MNSFIIAISFLLVAVYGVLIKPYRNALDRIHWLQDRCGNQELYIKDIEEENRQLYLLAKTVKSTVGKIRLSYISAEEDAHGVVIDELDKLIDSVEKKYQRMG